MQEAGVYQIRCLVNDRVYIGSTRWLEYRKKTHFSDLKKHDHHNINLQNDYDEYGRNSFVFEVIQTTEGCSLVDLEDKLELLESFYANITRVFNYNLNPAIQQL